MDKVNKVMNAWTDLITNHTNTYTSALQVDIENLEFESQFYAVENKICTKDRYVPLSESATYSIICAYYYNYVNNNTGWYNIKNWVFQYENSDELMKPYYDGIAFEDNYNTNDILMLEAGSVARFLMLCDNITATGFIETNEYIVSGIESAYVMNLNCDGDTNLNAVFDKDGNMLTIRTEVDGDYYKSNLYN